MSVHLLLLGLIGALSGVLAIIANQRTEPFYSFIVTHVPSVNIEYTPKIKRLYSARQAVAEKREIRIRDGHREDLQTIHEILVDEYGLSERYYPISLRFPYNAFKLQYADNRTEGRGTSRDEILSLIDSRISNIIAKVAAYAGVVSFLSFVVLIVLALI